MKALWVLMVLLLVILQAGLWHGEGSISEMHALQAKVARQREINNELVERNRLLAMEVRNLKHGEEAIEAHAREGLGLIGPEETFFMFVN